MQGVPAQQVSTAVAEVIARVSLPHEMAARPAGQLSGGNKRKLALGIALVGGTTALLLDEPSSGMVGFLALFAMILRLRLCFMHFCKKMFLGE